MENTRKKAVTAIKDLQEGMKHLFVTGIILEIIKIRKLRQINREVTTVKLADATACVNFTMWGKTGALLSPGDIIRVGRAYTNLFHNRLTLLSGKRSMIYKVGNFCMLFNENVDMSEEKYYSTVSQALRPPGPLILTGARNHKRQTNWPSKVFSKSDQDIGMTIAVEGNQNLEIL